MKKSFIIAIISLLNILCIQVMGQHAIPFPYADRIKYDTRCFQIEGKDKFIYSGTFHYFRTPKQLWPARFQKMKAAGFNAVETYIPWNWHEQKMPASVNDFSKIDLTDLEAWLKMAEAYGFYITVRPGPYICAEWDAGGFPQWLMQKRPQKTLREVWLQSDDPEFLKWNKHWYSAVCNVISPHQITQKPVGSAGVILFQIENEFNRIKWFSNAEKTTYLEYLTTCAKEGGIDVPIMTCWTDQTRNAGTGPLKGILDFVNAYPKWEVNKSFGGLIEKQLKTQPSQPLASMELQAGLYSEVGGQLSRDIEGTGPVQSQNITLYALQRGFCFINFYMLCGGTNFDDWASRQTTTTYDFGAAIQENGSVNDRYYRLAGIGQMLQEHGTRLLRSEPVDLSVKVTDPAVQVALRCATDGSRYFFIRTEEHTRGHFGTINVREVTGRSFSFDFNLEPFGSKIFFLPAGAKESSKGDWLPKPLPPPLRPPVLPDSVKFSQVEFLKDPLPVKWTSLKAGTTVDHYGVFDRHFIYYRAAVPAGKTITLNCLGNKVVNGTEADAVLALVNDKLIKPTAIDLETISFQMPAFGNELFLLFENKGSHQHTNKATEDHWLNGIKWLNLDGQQIPLQFACTEKEKGLLYSLPNAKSGPSWPVRPIGGDTCATDGLLSWRRIRFNLPDYPKHTWYPWHLHAKTTGNGFIYLNGHCLGRHWANGPQVDYYLPESWLNFGKGKTNIITFSLRPNGNADKIESLSIVPDYDSAEFR